MKLSTAILLGSIGSEQGKGNNSVIKGSINKCVIGAALFAVNQEEDTVLNNAPYKKLAELWPWTKERTYYPITPHDRDTQYTYIEILWRLNDAENWTRPQIAAWVATIEPQELEYNPLLTPTSCEQECKA